MSKEKYIETVDDVRSELEFLLYNAEVSWINDDYKKLIQKVEDLRLYLETLED